jgi:hypothetical protein
VHGRGHDDTTVSADSPAWIQIPRVTVNKLSCAQLANLVQWKAPLPIQHTEQTMLNSFFGVRLYLSHPNPNPHPNPAAACPALCLLSQSLRSLSGPRRTRAPRALYLRAHLKTSRAKH